jgi:1,4-dihydroxy-2-naphthoate octaprenyltransferase
VALGFGPVMVLGAYYVQAKVFSWEALYASIPVGILVALILYVNEVPDRPGDSKAGKRTLPVRWTKDAVIAAYVAAVAVAAGLVLGGAVSGFIPRPTILALAAFPLALPVYRALRSSYDNPYALMPAMAKNIQLHVFAGMGLIVGYVIAIIADHLITNPPFFLR